MKRANDFLVGLSVLVVSTSLVGATIWANASDIGQRRTRVVGRFHDVGNARVGNSVVVRGVSAGRIDAIELADDGWVLVRMRIDPAVRLPAQPAVLLNESSLFGEWQATITERSALPNDESVRRQVADAADAGTGAIPGATLPDIAKLTAIAGQIAGDVASVAQRFGVAFDEQAARELRGSIQHFSQLSSTLSRTVHDHATDLDTLSTKLTSAVAALDETAARTRSIALRVDSSASPEQVRQIVTDVSRAAADLRTSSAELRTLADRLAQSQGKLDVLLEHGGSVMGRIDAGQGSLGLLVNDPALYRHGDSLLVEMRALVADMRTHPKKYVNVRIF